MKKPDLIHPLHCWDVYTMYKSDVLPYAVNQSHFKRLQSMQNQFGWKVDLHAMLSSSYDALVLTDKNVIIQWVCEGFHAMTGYTPSFVQGKSPKILQGKNTAPLTLKSIRAKLEQKDSFTETPVNYRKNGEEYLCRIEVHPIANAQNAITHFLALEAEVK